MDWRSGKIRLNREPTATAAPRGSQSAAPPPTRAQRTSNFGAPARALGCWFSSDFGDRLSGDGVKVAQFRKYDRDANEALIAVREPFIQWMGKNRE